MLLMRRPVNYIPSHKRYLPPIPMRFERAFADDADVRIVLAMRVHGQLDPLIVTGITQLLQRGLWSTCQFQRGP